MQQAMMPHDATCDELIRQRRLEKELWAAVCKTYTHRQRGRDRERERGGEREGGRQREVAIKCKDT